MAAPRRLSITTPYRLSKEEQQLLLAAADTDDTLAGQIAALLMVDVDKWRKKKAQEKLADLMRFEQLGAVKATMTKASQAHRQFAEEAEIVQVGVTTADVLSKLRDEVAELRRIVEKGSK